MMSATKQFYVGDRVVCIRDHPDGNSDLVRGFTGTVCVEGDSVGVCWDSPIDSGHSCKMTCEEGYGWFVRTNEINLIPPEDFVFDEEKFSSLLFRTGSEEG